MLHGLILNLSNEGYANRHSGAHRMATELRSQNWDIEVFDFIQWWKYEELKEACKSRITENTKFIAFSSTFSVWVESCELICKWLKEHYPDIKLIYGSGTFRTLGSKYLEYYLVGYGEVTTLKLLNWLFGNGDSLYYQTIQGIKVIKAEGAAPWKDPIILYEDRDFIEPFEWLGIEFSRGCRYSCAYCNHPNIGVKGDWSRDTTNVDLQLKNAYDRFGTTRYMVSDETFNDSVEKIRKFANIIDKLNFEPFLTGFIRADLLVSKGIEEWEEMARMRFFGHFYGIETFNHRTGKIIGKGMHPDKLKQGLIDVKNYFLNSNQGFYRGMIALVLGLPHESEESMQDGLQWLLNNWQGQSFLVNSLEISAKDFHDNLNQNSKLTLDYEKYGYKKLKEVATESQDSYVLYKQRDNNILWENEHTNSIEVFKMTEKWWFDSLNYDFKMKAYQLGEHVLEEPIEEILTYHWSRDMRKDNEPHVRRYIDKKLGSV